MRFDNLQGEIVGMVVQAESLPVRSATGVLRQGY